MRECHPGRGDWPTGRHEVAQRLAHVDAESVRDGALTSVIAAALIAWLGGFVSIVRFQRTYRPWLKPLLERGEVAPFAGVLRGL